MGITMLPTSCGRHVGVVLPFCEHAQMSIDRFTFYEKLKSFSNCHYIVISRTSDASC